LLFDPVSEHYQNSDIASNKPTNIFMVIKQRVGVPALSPFTPAIMNAGAPPQSKPPPADLPKAAFILPSGSFCKAFPEPQACPNPMVGHYLPFSLIMKHQLMDDIESV
jgi:hypothetical protein